MATYEVFQEFERVHDFQCIADKCEDNCCYGWKVSVSKRNFDNYAACSDVALQEKLTQLVVVDPDSKRNETFASLTLPSTGCGFLAERLCSIQSSLGEDYLPSACDTFPRILNGFENKLETSLDLACPEAARLVLLDPKPLQWVKASQPLRLGTNMVVSEMQGKSTVVDLSEIEAVQKATISLLQRRDLPVWRRLGILGYIFEETTEESIQNGHLKNLLDRICEKRLSDLPAAEFDNCIQSPSDMATSIELIIGRLSTDFTSPRFRDCYREFMGGINWTEQSLLDDMHVGYTRAYYDHFRPFAAKNEHILENLLVNNVISTLFPLGSSAVRRKLGADHSTPVDQFILMATQFALTQLMLIGSAGFHRERFDESNAVRVIQACTKTFEHSVLFPGLVRETLRVKGMFTTSAVLSLYAPLVVQR